VQQLFKVYIATVSLRYLHKPQYRPHH